VLRPAITWLDQRRVGKQKPLSLLWRTAFKLARVDSTIEYFRREAEINWIAEQQPEIWQQTHKYLLLSGFLNFRLCGRHVDSTGSQVAYLPFDYKRHKWAGPRDWKWEALKTRRHAAGTGGAGHHHRRHHRGRRRGDRHPEGTPLVAAAADKACEVIGAGSLSRTSPASVTAPPPPSTPPAKIRRSHAFHPAVSGGGAGRVQHRSADLPRLLDGQLVQGAVRPSGTDGRRGAGHGAGSHVRPAGERSAARFHGPDAAAVLESRHPHPGPEAKGAMIGFGDVHTRAHMYRAILEGLAYALSEGKERIEKRSGVAVTELRIAGGGSQSDAAMQLTADIFGLPAARAHVYETSGLGAAIAIAAGLGLHQDFDSATRAMTRVRAACSIPSPPTRKSTTSYTGASTSACTSSCSRCISKSPISPATRSSSDQALTAASEAPPVLVACT
jgi:sugar (pentulose or hexulose) kinase